MPEDLVHGIRCPKRAMSPCETNRRNVNNVVQPLLTDMYQITMAYAYWKSGKKDERAVFDLFFRKNPFRGEFTVFAGLEDVLLFLEDFSYTEDDISYLKHLMPVSTDPQFFDYLRNLTADDITLYSMPEGTVVFPKVPLLRVEGPLPVCQLLETTLLTLTNFASLITTNAARFRIAAGSIEMLEFGLRRAQGPDGGLSASKYSYVGGCDATSNVLAGKLFHIPVRGTHAHAFVMSYKSTDDLPYRTLADKRTGEDHDFIALCEGYRSRIAISSHIMESEAKAGEFAAFIAYAMSFPEGFLALIDTYDVLRNGSEDMRDLETDNSAFLRLRSGVLNFCAVACALHDLGYEAAGVRIDSGDLAYLSNEVYNVVHKVAEEYKIPKLSSIRIMASNDINEDTLIAIQDQENHINCFGIGTNLVTCQRQPALGCVYKLVQIEGAPTIKLSLDVAKVTIPGKKIVYRLYGADGLALVDLMQTESESAPVKDQRILCRHPFQESKRAYVKPSKVELLLKEVWSQGKRSGSQKSPSLEDIRKYVNKSLATIRSDIKRYLNPTPYKVSVTAELYDHIHTLWLDSAPIGELH